MKFHLDTRALSQYLEPGIAGKIVAGCGACLLGLTQNLHYFAKFKKIYRNYYITFLAAEENCSFHTNGWSPTTAGSYKFN